MQQKANIIPVFILVTSFVFALNYIFPDDVLSSSSIDYKPLNKSGVKILIREYQRRNDDTFEFDIYRKDISIKDYIWSLIWGKNFGFYMEGINTGNKNLLCPYVGEDDKRSGSEIKDIGNGKHHVTLVLPPTLIDAIISNRCAVSPKPRKAPKVKSKPEDESKKALFPTVY